MENEKRLIVDSLKRYHDSQFTPGVYEHSIFGKAALLLEVDAVEVCRCKDCKTGHKLWFDDKGVSFCRKLGIDIKPDDFCSYGERREGE